MNSGSKFNYMSEGSIAVQIYCLHVPIHSMSDDSPGLGALCGCGHLFLAEGDKVFVKVEAFPPLHSAVVLHSAAFQHPGHGVLWNNQHTSRKIQDGHLPAVTGWEELGIEQRVYCGIQNTDQL